MKVGSNPNHSVRMIRLRHWSDAALFRTLALSRGPTISNLPSMEKSPDWHR